MKFAVSADSRVKIKERKRIDQYVDLVRELKKVRNMKLIPIVVGALETIPQNTGGIKSRRKNQNHKDHSSDKIG